MKVKYFKDTDTALLEFSDAPVDETREIAEHVVVHLDKNGNLVSMTIEHAALLAQLPQLSLEEFGIMPADPAPTDPLGFMARTVVVAHDLVSPEPDASESSDTDPLAQP